MKKTKTRLAAVTLLILGLGAKTSFATRMVQPPGDGGGPVMCGGNLGWWSGEPFYTSSGVWSAGVTANCADGSIVYIVVPVTVESASFKKPF